MKIGNLSREGQGELILEFVGSGDVNYPDFNIAQVMFKTFDYGQSASIHITSSNPTSTEIQVGMDNNGDIYARFIAAWTSVAAYKIKFARNVSYTPYTPSISTAPPNIIGTSSGSTKALRFIQ